MRSQQDRRETGLVSSGVEIHTRGWEHVWLLGDGVLLSSPETGVHAQSRVVCCERLEKKNFAIGGELAEE